MQQLQSKLGDTAFLAKTFGAENVNAAQFMIKNNALFSEMTGKVTGTHVALEQAAVRTQTYAHQMKVARANIDDFKISVFSSVSSLLPHTGIALEIGAEFLQMAPALMAAGQMLSGVGRGVMWLTKIQNIQMIATKMMTAAQWLLNIAMNANPIGLIVAGVALLAAGIYWAYQKFDAFRGPAQRVYHPKHTGGGAGSCTPRGASRVPLLWISPPHHQRQDPAICAGF